MCLDELFSCVIGLCTVCYGSVPETMPLIALFASVSQHTITQKTHCLHANDMALIRAFLFRMAVSMVLHSEGSSAASSDSSSDSSSAASSDDSSDDSYSQSEG